MRFIVLLLVLGCACSREFDPSVRDEGIEDANHALEVCQEHRPDDAGELPLLLSTPTTAGTVAREARSKARKPADPWETLPADHFVAFCSFGNDPDGDTVGFYVDEAGRSTSDDVVDPPRA
jgi:hypothetical protein